MTIVKGVPGNTAVCDPIETGSTTQREDQVILITLWHIYHHSHW